MRRSLLLAVCSLCVFAGLLEGVTRLAAPNSSLPEDPNRFRFDASNRLRVPYHERDPYLGWRLARGMRVRVSPEGGASGTMRINAEGFRGADFAPDKPAGTFRMLFVGDSNPMGFPLGDDRVPYPAQTERMLRDAFAGADVRFESINLAVDGYSSFQVRRVVERYVGRLSPDVVVVQVGFNDHTTAPRPDADLTFTRPRVLTILDHSHAYRLLRRWVIRATHRASADAPVARVGVEEYRHNLETILDACDASGAEVILVATAARPSRPLVINEVNVGEPGDPRWMSPEKWVEEAVEDAGLSLDTPADSRLEPVLDRLIAAKPDNPAPYYHLERVTLASGDTAAASQARAAWRARDRERDVLASYMEALRDVAADTGTPVVDVGDVLHAYVATHADVHIDGLFVDFVHMDARGHSLLAQAIGHLIASIAVGSGRVMPPEGAKTTVSAP